MIGDIVHQKGPMTGIYSVLTVPDVSSVFVTACDMPFINVILIKYLIERWTGNRDAVIPINRRSAEPLFGIYSKRIARALEDSIGKGERSLQNFLKNIDVLYIDEEEVRRRDPEGKSFVNINTLEDYQRETGGKACLG
jgi:molybdopterin-guanine dinucleotide biosynthesis protein A